MGLKIYNTMTGKKEEFVPVEKGKIGMYVCGVTAYDHAHIGHGRAYICFDAVHRYLKFRFEGEHKVTFIRNITDVDDKIIKKSNEESLPFEEVAKKYSDSLHEDIKSLGLLLPDKEPRASQHIEEMKAIIRKLEQKGLAYKSNGDVYYSVSNFKNYGKLSKRSLEEMEAGARVEVSDKKRNPMDFALWKAAKEGEPSWEFNDGRGRPGWHIECSAMSSKYLGETFDIHGGGKDLVFPHHENEIAQSEGASGKSFAKYWMHCGFVNMNKEKMSKSLGNVINIKELLKKYSPDAIKLFILQTHYRSPIDFADEYLKESEKAVCRVYTLYKDVKEISQGQGAVKNDDEFEAKFIDAMDDDFNTAKAIGYIFDYVNKGFTLIDKIKTSKDKKKLQYELSATISAVTFASSKMGLFESRTSPDDYFHNQCSGGDIKFETIEKLIEERNSARAKKDWKKADEIRNRLLKECKVELEDKKDGTRWKFIK